MTQVQKFDIDDPRFEVVMQKTGRVLQVQEYSYTQDFLGSTDSFAFIYYAEDRTLLRGLEMQPVQLRINDRPQLYGRIDATERGNNGSAVHCEGRDYISDLVESNIDPKCILKDGMMLSDAILYLVAPCGIVTIEDQDKRINSRTGRTESSKDTRISSELIKDLKPTAGRGIYEVCEEMLARYGFTLQPATSRTAVVVQSPTYLQLSIGRITRTYAASKGNLVLSGEARRDYSSFPTHTIFTGKQGGPAEKGGAKGTGTDWDLYDILEGFPQEMKDIVRTAIVQGSRDPGDSKAILEGVLYRLLYFRDDTVGKTQEQIGNSMWRAISDRMKETLRYTCRLRGHTNPVTGYNWTVDTLIDVDDDMADVHEQLWCHKATFTNSRSEGPVVELSMIRPGTFQIFADSPKPKTKKQVNMLPTTKQ